MKRRNESEEYQDFEMSGWNGFTSSEPSHALTPSGPGRKGSRSKVVKQFKNAPQTPGGSANGGVFFLPTGISVWNAFIISQPLHDLYLIKGWSKAVYLSSRLGKWLVQRMLRAPHCRPNLLWLVTPPLFSSPRDFSCWSAGWQLQTTLYRSICNSNLFSMACYLKIFAGSPTTSARTPTSNSRYDSSLGTLILRANLRVYDFCSYLSS